MPEQLMEKLKRSILPQWKVCFFTALVMGLVAHLFKITNWLPNWDSLVFRHDAQNMLSLGRWFLGVVCAPGSFYELPWLSGLLAIVFHALGAVCICKIFGVKKEITAALIGATVVTFPTVTSVMLYGYVSDGYALAFLLSCLSALWLTQDKPNYVCAILGIALSAGIYQAYVTVTILLVLCYLIRELISTNILGRKSLLKGVKMALAGAAGMGLYYLVLLLLLRVTNTKLLDYQGVESAFSMDNLDLWHSVTTAYYLFKDYFFDFSTGISVFAVLNCVFFVLTAALYIADALHSKIKWHKLLVVGFYVLLLPIGACVLVFINCHVDYHNLMKMGFWVFYLFLILQYETEKLKPKKLNAAKRWAVFALCVLLAANQTVLANVTYHKTQMAYAKSYGALIRLADRMEQTEGAEQCTRILLLGGMDDTKTYSVHFPPDITGATEGMILKADDASVGQSFVCSALNDYCGKEYTFICGDEKAAYLSRPEIENMGVWPAKDCILVADDVLVIRLDDER